MSCYIIQTPHSCFDKSAHVTCPTQCFHFLFRGYSAGRGDYKHFISIDDLFACAGLHVVHNVHTVRIHRELLSAMPIIESIGSFKVRSAVVIEERRKLLLWTCSTIWLSATHRTNVACRNAVMIVLFYSSALYPLFIFKCVGAAGAQGEAVSAACCGSLFQQCSYEGCSFWGPEER